MAAERFVIIGSGLAAARAIEGIRDAGGTGPITMIGEESDLPYDRPPLAKDVLLDAKPEDSAYLHSQEWYDERQVDLRLGVAASGIDRVAHTVSLAEGSEVSWDRLLLATGSSARRLDVPGGGLRNIHYLRTVSESVALRDRLREGGSVVIIGAGWIGLEVAAAARHHGCAVTIVEPQATPLFGVLGAAVGGFFTRLHAEHDVTFRFGDGVERFTGDDAVHGVVVASGAELAADTVVVGVGIVPNTRLATDAGLDVDNGIVCTQGLRTSAADIFAAGDVASWFNPAFGHQMRVDHWANAHNAGYAAGRAMAGEDVVFDAVPYFFSDQYDVGLEYAGFVPPGTDTEVVFRGDPAGNEFLAFWLDRGRPLAGMHVNVWGSIDDVKDLVRRGEQVDVALLADPDAPLTAAISGPDVPQPTERP